MADADCLFCRIASGEVEGRLLYKDDLVAAFDLPEEHPAKRAPVHFLVVPREHIESARETGPEHEAALGRLFTAASRIAAEKGIAASGYRLVSNTGEDANQTVFHLHLHCAGGKTLRKEWA